MTEKTQKALDNILDCFSGVDGGGRFCRLKWFLEDLESRQETEAGADEILEVMFRFSRLINVANKS